MLVHLFRVGIRGGPVPGKPLLPLRFQTFSAVRSSDGRPSACLLGVMAQLRSQLRARLPRAAPAPIRSPSAWRWVGGVLLGPLVLSKCPRLSLVALCEAEEAPLARSRPRVLEPRFNWTLFWQFLRPHLLVLGAAIVLALGAALVNVQIPLLLGQLVEIVAKYTRDHAGSFLTESRSLSTHLLLLYGLQGLLTFGYLVLLSRIGERMAVDLRRALFCNLLRQDIEFFDAKKTGQLVSRLTTDVQEFKSSFKLVISQGLRSCTQVAGCLVSLSMLSTRLTLLLMVATPALMGVGTLMGSALRKLSRQCQEQVARATGVADEALGNVRTVRAFAMEQREEERYGAELEGSRCKAEELGRGIALFQGLSRKLSALHSPVQADDPTKSHPGVRKQVAPVSPFGFIPRHRRVTAGSCGWRPAWGSLHSSGVHVAARAQSPRGLRGCGPGADATVGPRPACLDALLSC
uniref:ATP-binding cassette, sub-family B, member 8 n=1 Tax=Bos taurus TaxID=9913 RepID=Q1JPH5_BOVIN|nr:ATP-binding cassette, sub-family B, member 8 [Bos taurus]